MNVGVIGLGKLGCSMLAVFAASGNNVSGFDLNPKVREKLRKFEPPVSETNLFEELEKAKENYKIYDSCLEILENSEIVYIIVPTPSKNDGTFETKYLENVLYLFLLIFLKIV